MRRTNRTAARVLPSTAPRADSLLHLTHLTSSCQTPPSTRKPRATSPHLPGHCSVQTWIPPIEAGALLRSSSRRAATHMAAVTSKASLRLHGLHTGEYIVAVCLSMSLSLDCAPSFALGGARSLCRVLSSSRFELPSTRLTLFEPSLTPSSLFQSRSSIPSSRTQRPPSTNV